MIWNKTETDYLIENYADTQGKILAEILNRSARGINQKANILNLKKSANFLANHENTGHFPKGNAPFNKGLKRADYVSEEGIKIMQKTQFKKGLIPHNSKLLNTEAVWRSRGRPYIMKKIEGKLRLVYKHIWLWEQEHGKVEKGFNVVFKNKNSLDCRLENLECISNQELMNRNSIHQYPEDLAKSIKKLNKIKKIIKWQK